MARLFPLLRKGGSLLGLLLFATGIAQGQPRIGNPTNPSQANDYGAYLPTDRTLTQAMTRASERLRDGEYHQAVTFLNEVLHREEDSFLETSLEAVPENSEKPASIRGLKATARRLLANLPPQGQEIYELLHAATARRRLDAALSAGQFDEIRQIAYQYIQTPAGREAAYVLAQMEADRGHSFAAAQWYDALLREPRAVAEFGPQLSLLSAVHWLTAGRPERAQAVLEALIARSPDQKIVLLGEERSLPRHGEDPLLWLQRVLGKPRPVSVGPAQWTTHRGNSARHVQSQGGPPHRRPRWQARVVNDPRIEAFLATRQQELQERGVVVLPAARPLAVGDVVLVKTPHNVVAIDWKTGKRIWETRVEEEGSLNQLAEEIGSAGLDEPWSMIRHPLEQRVWEDVLATSLGSDGKRLFVVRGLPMSPLETERGRGMRLGGFMNRHGMEATSPSNRLEAYDLATEGKLVWDQRGTGSTRALADAFFLGPPLAIHGKLYALAELQSAIYLLALDPASGRLLWKQPLASLERGISLDLQRRLTGAMPSYAEGMLLCPTAAGVLVAIDLAKRELAWAYRYPQGPGVNTNRAARLVWRQQAQMLKMQSRGNDRWLDSSVVIVEGRVFVTPQESNALHCLDLNTGELLWKSPRNKGLFLGCVMSEESSGEGGVVLLVGTDSITALQVQDGTPAWQQPLMLPKGTMPSGYGILSEGRYFLPLSQGEIFAIDCTTGKSLTPSRRDPLQRSRPSHHPHATPLGNLIAHRGTILSQTTLLLSKYDQTDVLRKQATTALAKNQNDTTALRELAEIYYGEEDFPEAIRLLRRAYAIRPDDPQVRELLGESLLVVLAADFETHQEDLPLLRSLVQRPHQAVALLRIEAQGLRYLAEPGAALDALLRMADLTDSELVWIDLPPSHRVRRDRWIGEQIGQLWSEASPQQRQAMIARIDTYRQSRGQSPGKRPTLTQLRHDLTYFSALPGADALRLALARQLVETKSSTENAPEAEIELLKLNHSAQSEMRASAAILMTRLLLKTGHRDEAEYFASLLSSRWQSEKPEGKGVSGSGEHDKQRAWQKRLDHLLESEKMVARPGWPRGTVLAKRIPSASVPGRKTNARHVAQRRKSSLRQLRREQIDQSGLGPSEWFISNDSKLLIARNPWGEDVYRYGVREDGPARHTRINSDLVQAAQLGHLLFVSLGHEIVALDTRQFGSEFDNQPLWKSYPSGRFPGAVTWGLFSNKKRGSLLRRSTYHSMSGRKRFSSGGGSPIGRIGPATPYGVVLQEQSQLKCVDPLSGEPFWTRSDIPPNCELLGDQDLLFAIDIGNDTTYVLNMIDGSLIDQHESPAVPWLLTSGRNIAHVGPTSGGQLVVKITDAQTGERLFEQEYEANTQMAVVEPRFLAIFEPSGQFQWIDVRSGKVLMDPFLQPANKVRDIQILMSEERLFLMVHSAKGSKGRSQNRHLRIGQDYPLVTGQVYALSMQTGQPIWPAPASVIQRGIALTQPVESPFLVFVDRSTKQDARGGNNRLRLLCLDKRTGRIEYQHDALPDTPGSQFRIRAQRGTFPTLQIETGSTEVRLTLTHESRPAEPPANEEAEAPSENLGQGLWGVGQRMGTAIQDALKNLEKANGPPPPEEIDETDDD